MHDAHKICHVWVKCVQNWRYRLYIVGSILESNSLVAARDNTETADTLYPFDDQFRH